MTLIHTALLCEAQPIIEKLKLTKIKSNTFIHNQMILIISEIGMENTKNALQGVFKCYNISKAINIGIAGCSDTSVSIGELFCTNTHVKGIKTASLTTVCEPTNKIDTLLVDMEAEAFISSCRQEGIQHFVFKVVSDYMDEAIPKKAFVTSLIRSSLNRWIELV